MTILYDHPDADAHRTPDGHPEQVARLAAVREALAELTLDRRAPEPATDEQILRCHPQRHLDRLRAAAPEEGLVQLDGDTFMAPGSLHAATLAAGAAVQAVDAVMGGEDASAFVAMRPPGHHAERTVAMGFCLFNTVAVAARHARERHGMERVAIVDFDVHHGNGTQDIFWDDPSVLFCSTHQMPLYPGTGAKGEEGEHGQIVNAPLSPGDGSERFREAFSSALGSVRRDGVEAAIARYADAVGAG